MVDENKMFEDGRPFSEKYGQMSDEELRTRLKEEHEKSKEMKGWGDE